MSAWAAARIGTTTATSVDISKTMIDAAKEEVQRLLRGLGAVERYAEGKTIFNAGENAHAVYRVMSGSVALWRRTTGGKRQIVDFRLPGEYFGVVHRPTHTINAEASSDCIVTAYPRGQVDEICDVVPAFHRSISSLLVEPAPSRRDPILDEMRTAKERIARLLLNAAQRAEEGDEQVLPISTRYIGERIDEPDELVCNSLDDLRAAGAVVRTTEGRLAVVNPSLLQSLA